MLARLTPTSNVVAPSRYQHEVAASITDIEGILRTKAEKAGVQITQPSWPISLDIVDEAETPTVKVSVCQYVVVSYKTQRSH